MARASEKWELQKLREDVGILRDTVSDLKKLATDSTKKMDKLIASNENLTNQIKALMNKSAAGGRYKAAAISIVKSCKIFLILCFTMDINYQLDGFHNV